MSTSEAKKSVLSSIFRRRGANGKYTRLFDDLDVHQREILRNQSRLDQDELPVIGSVEGEEKWVLLTTRRLIWREGSKMEDVPGEEILDVHVDLRGLQDDGTTKLEMRQLQISTATGLRVVEVEPGAPLSGVWNVLRNISARRR